MIDDDRFDYQHRNGSTVAGVSGQYIHGQRLKVSVQFNVDAQDNWEEQAALQWLAEHLLERLDEFEDDPEAVFAEMAERDAESVSKQGGGSER